MSEANLDFHYLTTPERISLLAKNFLNENFIYYKESQIKKSIKPEKDLVILKKSRNNHTFSQLSTRKFTNKKTNVTNEIDNEQLIIAQRIDSKNPQKSKKIISSKKVQQWAGIQIIKALLGIPTIPFK